jgi:hypothetical protein
MRELKPEERGLPQIHNGSVEVRFTNMNGETEVWVVKMLPEELKGVEPADIIAAYIDDGVDVRLARQAETIGRLMRVIRAHNLEEEARTA